MSDHARCPDCGAIGMDNCERARCTWDQWDDGTRVTTKQRADGQAISDQINAWLEKRWAAAAPGPVLR